MTTRTLRAFTPGRLIGSCGLAVVLSVIALGAESASAQCGETIDLAARHSVVPGPAPLALGDSVLYDAAQPVSGDGFHVNAMVCRTMAQGIAYLQPRAATLPVLVVVALGTNDTVSNAQIDTLLSILGPTRGLALVTPKGGNDPSVPALYRAAARRHQGRILVLDWERLSAGHPDWFAPDGIHLGGAAGIDAFARLIASSLSALPGSTPIPATPAPTTVPTPSTTTSTATTPRTTATTAPVPATTTPVASSTPPVQRPPTSTRPKPGSPASFSAAERGDVGRILLDIRLLVTAAVGKDLSLLGM
jgi:hypothetical protein